MWSLPLGVPMPNTRNQKFMLENVPIYEGEPIKSWLFRVSEHFRMSYYAVQYYYKDKRSSRLDQRSRLKVISDQISRVRSDIHQLNIRGDIAHARALQQIQDILSTVLGDRQNNA